MGRLHTVRHAATGRRGGVTMSITQFIDPTVSPAFTDTTITARFRSRSDPTLIHRTRHRGGHISCSCIGHNLSGRCWHARVVDQLVVDGLLVDLVLDVETSVSSGSICDSVGEGRDGRA